MKRIGYLFVQGFVLNALMLLIMYLSVQNFDSHSYGRMTRMLWIDVVIIGLGSLISMIFTRLIERTYRDIPRFPYEILSFIMPIFIFVFIGFSTRIYFSFALFAVSALFVFRFYKAIKNNELYVMSYKARIKFYLLAVSWASISVSLVSLALNYY